MGARQRTWLAFERRTALSGWIIDGGAGGLPVRKLLSPLLAGEGNCFISQGQSHLPQHKEGPLLQARISPA